MHPIFQTTNVPDRCQRDIDANVSYPTNSRYTLKWILDRFPNNDATFVGQQLSKPSDLLLYYNHSATVVNQWVKNTSVPTNRPDIPRSSVLFGTNGTNEDDVMLLSGVIQKAALERHVQKKQIVLGKLEGCGYWTSYNCIYILQRFSNCRDDSTRIF